MNQFIKYFSYVCYGGNLWLLFLFFSSMDLIKYGKRVSNLLMKKAFYGNYFEEVKDSKCSYIAMFSD